MAIASPTWFTSPRARAYWVRGWVRSGWGMSSGSGSASRPGTPPHRADDVDVAGAATQVAAEGVGDLRLGRGGGAGQQLGREQQEPGGAEAALQAVALPE